MLVECRRRESKQAREKKASEEKRAHLRQVKRTEHSLMSWKAGQRVRHFRQGAYERGVVKLSEAILGMCKGGGRIVLSIPDGYISETFVQRSLKDQWDVQLTGEEVHSICAKLRGEATANVLPVIVPRSVSSNEIGANVILGKQIKTLIVNLKTFVWRKHKECGSVL